MLNESKISRPRPRPRPGSWGRDRGRDRGQSSKVKAEAEANFLRSRSRLRPKINLWIKSIKLWLTTYRRIYIIMIKTTQFISHFLSHSNYLLSYCDVLQSANRLVSRSLLGCWFFCCRPRPGRGQMFEAETEVEAQILAWRPLWPRWLNISGIKLWNPWIIDLQS